MILFITGASHTGKTVLAQQLMERHKIPYLSIDHLKMGLIRSKKTKLNPFSENLTDYLWPILREMVKTAIENHQDLIIEGCYIPFTWKQDFEEVYLNEIKFICLILSENYIQHHFRDVLKFANIIEKRKEEDWTKEEAIYENKKNLAYCKRQNLKYILIDQDYSIDLKNIFQ